MDATKKPLKAMHVFSQSIKFLRNDLFKSLKNKIADIQEEDIHYVLTVPAIWDDSAKQFMREAAVKVSTRSNSTRYRWKQIKKSLALREV